MSEKEKKIVEKLKRAIPNMSDFDKGYILGKTEKMAEESAERGEKSENIKNPLFTSVTVKRGFLQKSSLMVTKSTV